VYTFGKHLAIAFRNSVCQARTVLNNIVAESVVRFASLITNWSWEILVLVVVFLLSAGLS